MQLKPLFSKRAIVCGIALIGVTLIPMTAGAQPFAYVANPGNNTVSVVNTATNAIVATVNVDAGPEAIAVTPDGTRVYVANFYASDVSVINTAGNAVIATIAVGTGPSGIAITPDGTRA